MTRYVGASLPRLNDEKFLSGTGRFVDDLELPGMLHAAIVRSPAAHGILRGIDRSGVGAVDLVLGPDEVRDRTDPVPVAWHLPTQRQLERPLIDERVRFVGEPVGVVVAASPYLAEDGADGVFVDVEELPPVATLEAATAPGAPLLYPDWGSNVAIDLEGGDEAVFTQEVFAASAGVMSTRMRIGRLAGVPMECRGVIADPDPGTRRLTIYTSTQAPHMVRDQVSRVLRLPQHLIRVIGPDVGGGFGVKDHMYEDELLVCLAALELGRPVRWIEDRRGSLQATAQARDEEWDVEIAYERDGRLRGLRVHGVRNAGAYMSIFGGGPLATAASALPGPYRWEAVRMTGSVVVTNRAPTGAYRGFGQPQAVYVRERAVELVAGALDMDPVEVRAANMIAPDELPYTTRTSLTYESGDYRAALLRAAEVIRSAPDPPADGRPRGIGFSSYVEATAVGPTAGARIVGVQIASYESATVSMANDGSVLVRVGTSPHGQGHETTFAQLAADQLGIHPERVTLIHSDTAATPYSPYGTAASRSIALGGGAVVRAAGELAEKLKAVAGEFLEASAGDVVLEAERAHVAGTDRSVAIAELATAALDGRCPGMTPGLEASSVLDPENLVLYATHACQVAIDVETGVVDVERFVVVHDCGTIVNPMIVRGQIHGGVAQGIGAALLEEVAYDQDGQPLTGSLMDYLVPTTDTIPDIEIEHTQTPAPHIPGGMKGMGEGGTIGAPAAVANAVAAALPRIADRVTEIPLTPDRLWRLLHG
ncbi:MAG: xanthine dehydrogenase family protein molybdopterin-binding subunit [Actinomycetota bacterium]